MKKTALMAMLLLVAVAAWSQKKGEQKALPAAENTTSLQLGNAIVTWIKDQPGDRRMGKQVFNTVPDSLLQAMNLQDGIPSSMSCFLLTLRGKTILFDAGLGSDESMLMSTLAAKGMKADDVHLIYITHLHGDHIGGLMKDGKPVFRKAEIFLNEVEYEAWMNMPSKQNKQQREMLQAYKKRLHLFKAGTELPGGVMPIAAYGHTPGHTVFHAGQVLIAGDIMHGTELQMAHPEYCPAFDMDKEKAIEARQRIVEYARQNQLLMAGMHFPAPGYISFAPKIPTMPTNFQ